MHDETRLTFIEALTRQLQAWPGNAADLTRPVVAEMVANARAEAMRGVSEATIRVESTPERLAQVTEVIKQIFPILDESPTYPNPDKGLIYRHLTIQVAATTEEREPNVAPRAAVGRLDPARLEHPQAKRIPTGGLIYEALTLLAKGLLDFPTDEQGRRRFSSAYPQRFQQGIAKLSAHLLTQGVVISDPLEYWRILSKPLVAWPGMPPDLQIDEGLIDHAGRTTPLVDRIADEGAAKLG